MQNASSISSEEELLQLRDEGKINEAEYDDLLAAMRASSPDQVEEVAPRTDDARIKRKQGKIAFVMMLAAVIFPIVILALDDFAPAGEQIEISKKPVESQDSATAAEDATELEKEAEEQAERLKEASEKRHTWMLFTFGSCLLLNLALGIAAFVLGVISWPDAYGKAAVITISILGFLTLVIAVLGQ
jgi:nitrate reductase NapE component